MANQTYFCTLTAVGEAKDANAKALGTALKLTEMAVGDGNGALPTPDRARTSLVRQVRRAPLNTLKPDPLNPGQLIAEQIIPEDVGGWWIRELGLYDDAGDLIAIGNCPETYKPQLAEGSGRVQVVRMVLIMSSAATVQLKIDPAVVLATRKYADDQDAAVEARMNAAVAALGASTQTALGGKADLAGATFTGHIFASKGLRIAGAQPLQASAVPGSFGMDNTTLRAYVGDSTGWAWSFCRRLNNVTTDLLTVTDAGKVGINTNTPTTALQVHGRASLGTIGASGQFALTLNPDTAGYSVWHLKAGAVGYDGLGIYAGSDAYSGGPGLRMYLSGNGAMGVGTGDPFSKLHVSESGGDTGPTFTISNHGATSTEGKRSGAISWQSSYSPTGTFYDNARIDVITKQGSIDLGQMVFSTGRGGVPAIEAMRLDHMGNLLVGVTSNTSHVLSKGNATVGARILDVAYSTGFYVGDGYGFNAASSCQTVMRITTTGRSISASGTINASGADYAEYMTKADTCGEIAKGQIVGVDAAGKLTDKWAEAVSFLVKSTDPSYVGGDTWGRPDTLGMTRPEQPSLELPAYTGTAHPGDAPGKPSAPDLAKPVKPVKPAAAASDEEQEAYQLAQAAYSQQLAAFNAAQTAYQGELATYQQALQLYTAQVADFERDLASHMAVVDSARAEFDTVTMPAYQQALAAFDAALEQARQRVDRIAYCGQVPVNVMGAKPGQYVVPVQDGEGIGGQLVDGAAIDFQQYRRAVGIVQNVLEDGRANVRVKPV